MSAKKKTDDLDEEILERLEGGGGGGGIVTSNSGPGAGVLALAGLLPLLAMGAVFVFLFCIARIPAGRVGVAYSVFGGVLPVEYEMGWHLKWPWIDITLYSIQTQDYTMSILQGEGKRTGDDRITALTSEGLNVDLDLTVLYKIDPKMADEIHTTLGETYDEKVIRTNIRSTIRKVAATHTAKEIYSEKRKQVEQEIRDDITAILKPYHILVTDLLLRNVELPPQLKSSIEEKQVAEQRALRMEYVLNEETKKAKQRMIEAEGIANATVIKAAGEALAIQRIQEQFGTKDPQSVLGYYYIKTLDRTDLQTVIVPTDSGVPVFLPAGAVGKGVA